MPGEARRVRRKGDQKAKPSPPSTLNCKPKEQAFGKKERRTGEEPEGGKGRKKQGEARTELAEMASGCFRAPSGCLHLPTCSISPNLQQEYSETYFVEICIIIYYCIIIWFANQRNGLHLHWHGTEEVKQQVELEQRAGQGRVSGQAGARRSTVARCWGARGAAQGLEQDGVGSRHLTVSRLVWTHLMDDLPAASTRGCNSTNLLFSRH